MICFKCGYTTTIIAILKLYSGKYKIGSYVAKNNSVKIFVLKLFGVANFLSHATVTHNFKWLKISLKTICSFLGMQNDALMHHEGLTIKQPVTIIFGFYIFFIKLILINMKCHPLEILKIQSDSNQKDFKNILSNLNNFHSLKNKIPIK